MGEEGGRDAAGHGALKGVAVGCAGSERDAASKAQGLALAKALNDYFVEEEAEAEEEAAPDEQQVQQELKQNRFLRADVITFVRRYCFAGA